MWSPQPKSRIIHQKLDHAHPHFHKTRPLTIQLQMMMKLTNNPTGTGFKPQARNGRNAHSLAFYRQNDCHVCPKTVRNANQTLALQERLLPSARYSSQEATSTRQLIPSFAVRASSKTKWGPKSFFGACQSVYFFMALKMVHILDLVLESTKGFFSQCRQNAWAAFSDNFYEIFGFCFTTSHPLDAAYISSRSWQMLCVSTRPSKNFTSTATLGLAMRESRPGGCSGGSLEDHRGHPDPMDLFQWFHNL